ncbi:hypothetical protein F4678DRAFT_18662 [Xylaria arbuscula]|nr:hypothetical protein F4678DRAFT_18662 [Xylaria arbuscula]
MESFHISDEMATLVGNLDDTELHAFAKLQKGTASDEQIKLYIYIHFLIFIKTQSIKCLNQAIQQTEGWLAITPTDHPNRMQRSQVLDMLVARKHQHNLLLKNIISMLLESRQMIRIIKY